MRVVETVAVVVAGAAVIVGAGAGPALAGPRVGEVTWYQPTKVGDGRGIGSCGNRIADHEPKAAVSYKLFDGFNGYTGSNPNANPICGRKIRVSYQGRSVVVTIADRCHDCQGVNNVDLTTSAFQRLSHLDAGRLYGASWDWA